MSGQGYMPKEHDCTDWKTITYCNQDGSTYEQCGICGRIMNFRYKKLWHRILSVFGVREKLI